MGFLIVQRLFSSIATKINVSRGMETHFLAWLRETGEPAYLYAQRRNLGERLVKRLAGMACPPGRRGLQFTAVFLDRVSRETGIPIGTLVEDAVKAAERPTPSRIYRRKNGENAGDTISD